MATILNRTTTFATNGTVTAAGLHNLIDDTSIYAGLITTQTELTTVGTADQLLIAVGGVSDTGAPRRATVQNLFDDALTGGTYTNLSLSGALTYGTATGNRTVSTSATITTGTIPSLTAGTTTSTAATITNGTITNGTITTALIPTLTAGTTTATAGIITSGTIATLNSTIGTIGTLRSTTGTIANLSTTLAGDFTISQGTGTLATSGATAGTYGSVTAIPFITVDAKGRITSATTGTFSSTPADGSITFAKLSTSATEADNVANRTSKAWVNFNGTGTVAIRDDFNVSSITDNGTGDYSVVFSSPLANANYAFATHGADTATDAFMGSWGPSTNFTQTTALIRLQATNDASASGFVQDISTACVTIFGS
jgi:hypothetical protein